ncbi:Zn-dependent alcohol dehydrogenase [Tomitella cavernea]|uniref:Zn-dependent alcohol dehydrogenase n=1 Tax=Tomitella cavernea TaxID=1387982 RepID=A0ABP9BZP8_9ACTN|nr:Zn-dependent alcohol dehydrogenase [Tomitella cavernea]
MKSTAAMLRTAPGALTLETIEVDAPAETEVRVKTSAVGLCHSDLHIIRGHNRRPLPMVLGHEAVGEVVDVGSQVTHVRPGDRVIACLSEHCGWCEYCLSGRLFLCDRADLARPPGRPPRLSQSGDTVHAGFGIGAFSEYFLVHQSAVTAVPDPLPHEYAALLGCAVVTGMGAVFHTAQVRPGETMAVVGCGGIGLSAIQAGRIAGAGIIAAFDTDRAKFSKALKLGATHVFDPTRPEDLAEFRKLTGGVDHGFDAVGGPTVAASTFSLLRKGGTCTLIGMPAEDDNYTLPAMPLLMGRRVQGSLMGSNRFPIDIPRYARMALSGDLDLQSMLAKTVTLSELEATYQGMDSGSAGRTVLVFDEESR